MTLLIHLTCLYMTLLDFDRANVFFFSDPPKTDFPHCKKRHLRSVPFLKQFRIFTENSGKELNVKESSLKISEEVFP
jgi:hypothetical protein